MEDWNDAHQQSNENKIIKELIITDSSDVHFAVQSKPKPKRWHYWNSILFECFETSFKQLRMNFRKAEDMADFTTHGNVQHGFCTSEGRASKY